MKRPSFQFYPADWRNDANLRRCSEAARGVWMDTLCLLHDSAEYGVLRWPLRDMAQALGVSLHLLQELAEKEVLKGGDEGCAAFVHQIRHAGHVGEPLELIAATTQACWYCSRMVRDEFIRQRRGSATRFQEGHSVRNQAQQEAAKSTLATSVDVPVRDYVPVPSPTHAVGAGLGEGPSSSSSSSKDLCVFVADETVLSNGREVLLPATFPEQHKLAVVMTRAGKPPPSPAHLQGQLTQFQLHFQGQRFSEARWYSKLLAWLSRNPEGNIHADTRTIKRPAGPPAAKRGFSVGDAVSEQWARSQGPGSMSAFD